MRKNQIHLKPVEPFFPKQSISRNGNGTITKMTPKNENDKNFEDNEESPAHSKNNLASFHSTQQDPIKIGNIVEIIRSSLLKTSSSIQEIQSFYMNSTGNAKGVLKNCRISTVIKILEALKIVNKVNPNIQPVKYSWDESKYIEHSKSYRYNYHIFRIQEEIETIQSKIDKYKKWFKENDIDIKS